MFPEPPTPVGGSRFYNHFMAAPLTRTLLNRIAPRSLDPEWELAAESIAVTIRWFGLVVGALLIHFDFSVYSNFPVLYAILVLGLGFTIVNTWYFVHRRFFLRDWPLLISAMEALFIGLLCHYENGPDSSFRFYYLLSLICCAIRYSPRITFITCGLDCLSYSIVFVAEHYTERAPHVFLLTLVILIWVTSAAAAMARLLKLAGEKLRVLNAALCENQALLESRIAERTRELEEAQARVLHQEKMAAFGLLAAGIAHEVGNPLAAISNIVQILQRRDLDEYSREKLGLVTGQMKRIQTILRELVTFSRPASDDPSRVSMREVIDEALGIAKFYRGGNNREITADVSETLPVVIGVRDQLVQVILNLVLNAIDATGKGGVIRVKAAWNHDTAEVVLTVNDNGCGILPEHRERLFHPYFTTKKHGTGLGIFVIHRIVQAHKGRVEVQSTPGEGTSFVVHLPTLPTGAKHGPTGIEPSRESLEPTQLTEARIE